MKKRVMTLSGFIFLILLSSSLLEIWIDALNYFRMRNPLPPSIELEFQGFLDAQKYEKSLAYQKQKTRNSLFQQTLMSALLLSFFLWGGFGATEHWVRTLSWSRNLSHELLGLSWIALLSIARGLFQIPFSFYDTFVVEAKFGFNRTTVKTFVSDLLKGTLIGAILGGIMLYAVLSFFERAGSNAFWMAWLSLSAFQLLIAFLAPSILLPLFNAFKPLPEGELRSAIESYAKREGFLLSGIFQMDGSKRSSKANAFFTGFGKSKRLVLFDTLIAQQTVPELVSVVAHEMGHFQLGHIPKMLGLSILTSGLSFWLLSFLVNSPELTSAFGFDHISAAAGLVCASFILSPVMRGLSVITSRLSRKHEFEADAYSARTYGQPESLISALKKLSTESFSFLNPHPLKVLFDYSHPPVIARIQALRAIELPLAPQIIEKLRARQGSLCTVESCTGGLIAHQITSVSGSSSVYWGGYTTYDNSAKTSSVGVEPQLITQNGAVSEPVAQAMAEGGLRKMQAALGPKATTDAVQICISTTGVAGPTGGSPEKPVGLCYIGIAQAGVATQVIRLELPPQDRAALQQAFAHHALVEVLRRIS